MESGLVVCDVGEDFIIVADLVVATDINDYPFDLAAENGKSGEDGIKG